jgi:hypothetical protein
MQWVEVEVQQKQGLMVQQINQEEVEQVEQQTYLAHQFQKQVVEVEDQAHLKV